MSQSLPQQIRTARERARLSQADVAAAVGVSLRTVGNWERGESVPRNRLGALEDVLQVSLRGEPAETVGPDAQDAEPTAMPVGAGERPEVFADLSSEEMARLEAFADGLRAARGEGPA